MSGKIISFEGIEGTGKSTQIKILQKFLESKKIQTHTVREPGNTYIGEQIRNLLQYDKNASNMCPETELLLYEASRAQIIREIIIPMLQQKYWIIFDRYYDSSTAYQGAARNLSTEIIDILNKFAIDKCVPNLTILLDIDTETAWQRLQKRKFKDRIENESKQFFENVRQKYLEMAKTEPNRFIVVDATQPIEIVSENICHHVKKFFSLT